MARALVFGGVVVLLLTVYAIVDCVLTESSRIRGLPRWAWIVACLLLPVLGAALWFVVGRGPVPQPEARVVGPDDDPVFLRSRRTPPSAVHEPDEAEWREFEQELANLDSDQDDDGDPRRR